MELFWVETKRESFDYKTYSYQDFLDYINSSSTVQLNFKSPDVLGFFYNLVLGILHNQDLVLFDLDHNDEDVFKLIGSRYSPKIVNVSKFNKTLDLEEVLNLIESSSSTLTFFTSGTTGIPKKVTHNLKNLLREVRAENKYKHYKWAFGYNPTHIAGIQLFFQALFNRNLMVNVFGRNRSVVFDLLEKFQISNIAATPSFFRMLLPLPEKNPVVRKITLGGEKSTIHLLQKLNDYFPNAKIYNIYASTEFGSILSSHGDSFIIRDKYSGFVKIENGTLLVHKNLLGVNSSFDLKDNLWYVTGDLIEFDNESKTTFRFIGRGNELINVGGEKVNPSEVENQLLEIDQIKECFVYGIDNSVLGKIVCADVVLYENALIDVVNIRRILVNKLQSFKIPRKINFVAELSKGTSGKIDRKIKNK